MRRSFQLHMATNFNGDLLTSLASIIFVQNKQNKKIHFNVKINRSNLFIYRRSRKFSWTFPPTKSMFNI